MARQRTIHRCTACDATALRWSGRCAQCGTWNSLFEEAVPASSRTGALTGFGETPEIIALGSIESDAGQPFPTGIGELDRALTGGLVPGSVTLVGGEPGVGKSTLLLQVAASVAARGGRVLIVSAEETAEQVRRRADRLGEGVDDVSLLSTTSLPVALAAAERYEPDLLVVDSIQTIADPELGSAGGTVTQVRACAAGLIELAKSRSIATVLVGHVTKDGSLAGPKALEHLVDTVCSFEGERHHAIRVLAVQKHRFGPAGELGIFTMGTSGLEGVEDPSGLLLGDRRSDSPGSIVAPVLEGRRPLLVEIQALVGPSALGTPRRTAQGLVPGRLALLLAVLEQRVGIALASMDVFASAVGGIRITEPGSDLALGMALASAALSTSLGDDLVACGEVGLGGEVRQVIHTERRLAEAARRGFTRALVPCSAPEPPHGMELIRVGTLAEAVLSLTGGRRH